jgi:hypothetical protein
MIAVMIAVMIAMARICDARTTTHEGQASTH